MHGFRIKTRPISNLDVLVEQDFEYWKKNTESLDDMDISNELW